MKFSRQRRATAFAAGLCLLTTLVFFARAIFTDDIFIARDIFRVYYPTHQYWAQRVLSGEFPQWFPFDALGQPFAGMTLNGPFHPANLLYLVLSLTSAMKVNIVLCSPFAFMGTWCLARQQKLALAPSLLAAVLYSFNGYPLSMTNNLPYLEALAALPWVLWAATRFFRAPAVANGLLCAFASACVLFAGDPQTFFISQLCVCVCALLALRHGGWRLTVVRLVGVEALTVGLTAVQWLPSFAVRNSSRFSEQTLFDVTGWSMHPVRMVELLVGPLFAFELGMHEDALRVVLKNQTSTEWATSLYLGAPWVALAVFGVIWRWQRSRVTRVSVAGALLLFLLMLGENTPVYGWFFRFVPLWSSFRSPEKLTPLFMLLLAMGAAVGLQLISRQQKVRQQFITVLFGATVLAGALAALEVVTGTITSGVLGATVSFGVSPETIEVLHSAVIRWLVMTAMLTLLIAMALRSKRLQMPVTLLLAVSALWVAHEPLSELALKETMEQQGPLTDALIKNEGPLKPGSFRIATLIENFPVPLSPNLSFVDSRSLTLVAAMAPASSALWNVESYSLYLPGGSRHHWNFKADPSLLPIFNVKYAVHSAESYAAARGPADHVVATSMPFDPILLRTDAPLPRAYVSVPLCVTDSAAARNALKTHAFNPQRETAVVCGAAADQFGGLRTPGSSADGFGQGRVTIVEYRPETVTLEATLEQPSVVVLNDTDDQGWSATVNGAPHPIVNANHLVRGLLLPAGAHRIEFHYRDVGLLWGARITGTTLVFGVLLLIISRLMKRRSALAD